MRVDVLSILLQITPKIFADLQHVGDMTQFVGHFHSNHQNFKELLLLFNGYLFLFFDK